MSATANDVTTVSDEVETEAATVALIATHAARPTILAEDTAYAYVLPAGSEVRVVDGHAPLAHPLRKTGTVRLLDATSFAAYVLKHADGDATQLYADPATPGVTALLNGHRAAPDATGWGDHRAVLTFRPTDAWNRWTANDGKLLNQVQFAEHVEASLPDIRVPTGADLLELAQSFQANTKVRFESSRDLGSGQRQLVYREEVEAGAGPLGNLTIPKEFELGLAPYEGTGLYKVTARLRYRIAEGRLSLGYVLDRPRDVQRTAFDEVLKDVETQTSMVALLGTPA